MKRKEILVPERGAFLVCLLALVLESLVSPLLKSITGGKMAVGQKCVGVKTQTPVNFVASTTKQAQENVNTVWDCVGFLKKNRFACIQKS